MFIFELLAPKAKIKCVSDRLFCCYGNLIIKRMIIIIIISFYLLLFVHDLPDTSLILLVFCYQRVRNCGYLRNRKHLPYFYRVIETRVEVWENEKCCGNTSRRRMFPQVFRVLPNFHECFYNSIET